MLCKSRALKGFFKECNYLIITIVCPHFFRGGCRKCSRRPTDFIDLSVGEYDFLKFETIKMAFPADVTVTFGSLSPLQLPPFLLVTQRESSRAMSRIFKPTEITDFTRETPKQVINTTGLPIQEKGQKRTKRENLQIPEHYGLDKSFFGN